jgi:hypothetical protein
MICLRTKSYAASSYRFQRISVKLTGEKKFRAIGLLISNKIFVVE